MSIFNQFSFVVATLTFGIILSLVLWRWRWFPVAVRIGVMISYFVLVIILGVSFRYPDETVSTVAEVEATLANGQSTFVMLYSNY